MKERNKQVLLSLVCAAAMSHVAFAETCTTQSQMQASERDTLASTAQMIAQKVQANDQASIQGATIPEFAANFSSMASAISSVAPKLSGKTAEVDQLYILDASESAKNSDGSAPDAEFICTLNKDTKKMSEADFSIRSLPPGRYAFAIVDYTGTSPWQLSMLLRQDGASAPWKLAGLFPKESSAAGHDGLWYWSQGRAMTAAKQPWVALVYYQEAQQLLQPAVFVSSTHLESLRSESSNAMPPEVANGIGPDSPLIVKAADGTEFKFISISPDDGLHNDKLDIAVHLLADTSNTDPAVAQKRNRDAMSAFVALHPEVRTSFHGIWVFADAPDRMPVATEAAMNDIH